MSVRGGIVPLLAALLLVGCIDEVTPEERAARDEVMQELIAKRDAAEEKLAARERELGRRIATLESENASLREQLGLAEQTAATSAAEAANYKSGLGKAVDELNRVTEQQAKPRYLPMPQYERRPQARVSTLGAPYVQFLGDQVQVTGRLWNGGEGDARGRLSIELLLNGQVIDEATQNLDLPARTDQAYAQMFRVLMRDGTYSARVRVDL